MGKKGFYRTGPGTKMMSLSICVYPLCMLYGWMDAEIVCGVVMGERKAEGQPFWKLCMCIWMYRCTCIFICMFCMHVYVVLYTDVQKCTCTFSVPM